MKMESSGAVSNPVWNKNFSQGAAPYAKNLPEPNIIYVVDFFCGCGGISYGFSTTRQSHLAFKVLAGIDIDRKALETYEANIPGSLPILEDIRKIGEDPGSLLEFIPGLGLDELRPLVFTGCAPCQGFSAHRNKDPREDPRNALIQSFAQICKYFKPDVVVTENVKEVLSGRYSKYQEDFCDVLKVSGYAIEQDVVDLSLYGLPQRRHRAITLASKQGSLSIPAPVFTRQSVPTVREAISHLPQLASGDVNPADPAHRAPKHTSPVLKRIRQTPIDGGGRRDLALSDQIQAHRNLDQGSIKGFTDVYGRLSWDKPSVTITAKSSTPSCGRFIHPDQHRNISVREAAILQGFPQTYVFKGPFVNQYRQIGEAVPPLFARFLAFQILDHLSISKPKIASHPATIDKLYSKSNIALVDAFCGAGGISYGFKSVGFHIAMGFDNDADAIDTFRKNVSKEGCVYDAFDPDLIGQIDESVKGSEYVMAGGPPCQGFSQQRRGLDIDRRNDLVLQYIELVGKLSKLPTALVLENVTYLDSPRGREILEKFEGKTKELGYINFRHKINSANFGIPQLRQRIILVAVIEPIANHYRGPISTTEERWTTVGEAFGDLVLELKADRSNSNLNNHQLSKEGCLNKRRIAYVNMGGGRSAIPDDLQLQCHKKYGGHLDVYGRLDWFGQARTITGGFDSFTRGEYAHPFLHRSITAREAARIQGFPDEFLFSGNRSAVRRQIGNAVPPDVAAAIGKAIADAVQAERTEICNGRTPSKFCV